MREDADDQQLAFLLDHLTKTDYLYRMGPYYALRGDGALVERRMEGNRRARPLLEISKRTAPCLYRFPFVRALFISGSLSKNTADEKGDIDYFVITAPGRLWIARTCLHLMKKLSYLGGKQHWYCMNYFVDGNALEIDEKNIFTAMEIVTLLPMGGDEVVEHFFRANEWTRNYFPGARPAAGGSASRPHRKRWMEYLFDNALGDWLDNFLMRLTTRRWDRKEKRGKRNIKGLPMGIRTGKHFCKPNPHLFQAQLLTRYHQKLLELEQRQAISLENPY